MGHIHEKIDFTTSVYIVQDGKALLHKHKKLGIWLPPGGHIELDEDPNQAVVREAKEESGLAIKIFGNSQLLSALTDGSQDLIPPMYINRHYFDESHEHVDFIYFASPIGGTLAPEEAGGEIRWFTKEEITMNAEGIRDSIRSYALAALAYFQSNK